MRVNSDLIGKFINIASRCAGFIHTYFNGQLGLELHDASGFDKMVAAGEEIRQYYASMQYSKAMREIMRLADNANQYIDHHKPWTLAKETPVNLQVQAIATQGLNLFKLLATYLQPVLPKTAKEIELFLNTSELRFDNRCEPLLHHTINPFKPLLTRITAEDLEAFA